MTGIDPNHFLLLLILLYSFSWQPSPAGVMVSFHTWGNSRCGEIRNFPSTLLLSVG